jgi:DNA-binding PadR family transcriptional regulator
MNLTNGEMALLSLLAEMPMHGYQIESLIEARGMRNWAEIGFSSIYYALNKMEKSGLVESHTQPEEGRPARRVYKLTDLGRQVLTSAEYQRLSQPHPFSADFSLALACLPLLPSEQQITALNERVQHLQGQEQQLQGKWQQDQPGMAAHVNHLFDYSLAQMRAERAWVENFIQIIQSQPPSSEGTDKEMEN